MRVIAGSVKGQNLYTLDGENTRPTSGKVKEAIFSAVNFDIIDTVVLDLYSGSGQMGIEALSRGAKYAIFIDSNKNAVDIIKKNLTKTKLMSKSRVALMDAKQFISSVSEPIDIAIIDPPYIEADGISETMVALSGKMSKNAIIICETDKNTFLIDDVGNMIKKCKEYCYGNTKVTIYRNVG